MTYTLIAGLAIAFAGFVIAILADGAHREEAQQRHMANKLGQYVRDEQPAWRDGEGK